MKEIAQANFSGKRLVIFGCGYLGLEVAARGLKLGCSVTAITRNPAKVAEVSKLGGEALVADLANADWHARLSTSPDFVLICMSSGRAGLEEYRRSYLEGMRSIASWMDTRPVGTVVYTSSTSVYSRSLSIASEESATDNSDPFSRILLETEDLLRNGRNTVEQWTILRLAGIYGPARHSLIDQMRNGTSELSGMGEQYLNLIHRDDAASVIFSVFQNRLRANLVLNVSDGNPATRAEIIDWLASRLRVPTPAFSQRNGSRRPGSLTRVISPDRLKNLFNWTPSYPDFRSGYEAILRDL